MISVYITHPLRRNTCFCRTCLTMFTVRILGYNHVGLNHGQIQKHVFDLFCSSTYRVHRPRYYTCKGRERILHDVKRVDKQPIRIYSNVVFLQYFWANIRIVLALYHCAIQGPVGGFKDPKTLLWAQ